MKNANRLLSFLLELAMLAAFAAYGASLGESLLTHVVLALTFVVVVLWFWAVYMAPRARKRIAWPWTPLVALLLFLIAALALLLAKQQTLAMVLAGAAVVNATLTLVLRQK